MTTLEHQIIINAPKEKVFDALENLELVQEYNPSVLSARYISHDRAGVGAARECNLGKDGLIRERVTAVVDNQSISMELYEHNWPLEFMTWTTRLENVNGNTLLSQSLEYKVKFGLLGALLDRLMMKNKLDSTIASVFESMKLYIEGST